MRLSASRRKPVERTGRFGAWRRRPARDESLQSPFGKKKPPRAFASKRLIQFLFLVRLAGFEPTTPWFVAKYSIQLSYSREAVDYSTSFEPVRRSAPLPRGTARRAAGRIRHPPGARAAARR